ncbi:hypothetical protein GCM10010201_23520 [Pilimelia columellifera subsp. columellifera]|uniref:Uncharacterized protein n=1 Tax=Pilimelia columellifera subsp. columellifera TaxID=706583 RepID=A0ABN3NJV4_9ACTN
MGRYAGLLATAAVVGFMLLRAREHEADLRAGTLTPSRADPPPAPRWWRRVFNSHPTPVERARILRTPELFSIPRPVDAFGVSMLLGSTWIAVQFAVQDPIGAALTGSYGGLVAAAFSGVLLTGTVGMSLRRQASTGARWPVGRRATYALALVVGAVLGQTTTVAITATGGWFGPYDGPLPLLVPLPVLLGSCGLAWLVARATARAEATSGAVRLATTATHLAVFSLALLIGQEMQMYVHNGATLWGAILVEATVQAKPASIALAMVAIAVAAAAVRGSGSLPTRLRKAFLPALAAAVASAAVVFIRAEVPNATDQDWIAQVRMDFWLAAVAGAAAATATLAVPGRKASRALVTGPATAVLASVALFALRAQLQPSFSSPGAALLQYLTGALSILCLAILAASAIALLTSARSSRWPNLRYRGVVVGASLIASGLSVLLLRTNIPLIVV